MRILLAFADVGLGIPLQEALEGLGRDTRWDPAATPARVDADPPDVVVLDADGVAGKLVELAAAWRALDPAPGLLAIGMTADAVSAAGAARVTLVPPTAPPAVLDRALADSARLRFTAALSPGLARRAVGLPPGADEVALVAAARGLDIELARAALRWHSQHYVTATAVVDELRAARALIPPEIEQVAHLDGTLTLQTVVRAGPLEAPAAARLVWVLAALGAVTLGPEPPDRATPARRLLTELRAHLRARTARLARATFYDVLEVTPFAEVEDLELSYRALAWRYGPRRTDALDLGDASPLVAPAWDQIERARKVLHDVAARGRYNDWLRDRWHQTETAWAIDGAAAKAAAEAYARAQQALTSGDVHRALSEMATAARHHPGHPEYEAGLAWTRYRVEVAGGREPATTARRERAVAERATSGTRPWPRALLALALLCVADRDPDSARWHLREALAIDPGSPAARQLMARLGG
ncbi:MAG: J domain-containing protein [Kofleriaceae bacterium]|nr:J domain-containing protein [Kofleriaceae bacterium]MCL4224648.1 J domain-containing protein [Myxococcales bacterium]